MSEIRVGDLFPTYESFKERLRIYEEKNFVKFYRADSKTLQKASAKYPRRVKDAPMELEYYCLKLKCIHGGTFFKSKSSTGMRKSSTLKIGCEAFLMVKLSEDAQNLVVSKMSDVHNHEISKDLPRMRIKTTDVKAKNLQGPKKRKIFETTGNMKDDKGNKKIYVLRIDPKISKDTVQQSQPIWSLSDIFKNSILSSAKESSPSTMHTGNEKRLQSPIKSHIPARASGAKRTQETQSHSFEEKILRCLEGLHKELKVQTSKLTELQETLKLKSNV